MPLVDYESSDEGSENENEVEDEKGNAKPEEKQSNETVDNATVKNNPDDNATLFSSLPKPRKNFSFLGDDNKLSKILLNKSDTLPLGKKHDGESIKISVPSISEFEEDGDQPPVKKIKPSANGVGLFSVLPPPKNNAIKETKRTLVPHAVAKNQKKSEVIAKYLKVEKETEVEEPDDDAGVGSSFFGTSLSEPSGSAEVEGTTSTEYMNYGSTQNQSDEVGNSFTGNQYELPQNVTSTSTMNEAETYDYSLDSIPLPETIPLENNPLKLDEKALQILCGGKKKRQQMPMNIIDLSGEEIMPDSKEWLLKQFTEEKKVRNHNHKKGFGPSSQSRRKHQITYLAYQAKEMELELQNQWANNRMSRKQTQSKYGF